MKGAAAGGPRSALWFARDVPNLCSLAGLASAVLGIYFAVLGVFPAAMIGVIWSVVLDWLDGRIARGMNGRTAEQREFGAQLDSLIDVVSFGVAPAILLLSVGGFSPWFLPGAMAYLAAAAVRLSYFNVFGLADGSLYRGLALDNNAIIIVAVFSLQPMLDAPAFAIVVHATLMLLACLNIAPIRTPKLTGRWYYAIVVYAILASAFYGWRLFGAGF